MHINTGTLLVSTPSLNDSHFEKTVVFIAEHNEKGALGFIINKKFPKTFNQLAEFKQSNVFPLHTGGPVEDEKLFFLHQHPAIINGGIAVIDSIYMGGDFKQAVAYINNSNRQPTGIKLFIGYCGWDYNELEEEIKEGSWQICNINPQLIFNTDIEMLWDELYKSD